MASLPTLDQGFADPYSKSHRLRTMEPTESSFVRAWQPRLLSVFRIVIGFLFMQHGGQKLLNFPPMPHPMNPPLDSLIGIAALLELVGGGLIILGFLTRPVAFVLSGEMAFAYFMEHAPHGFWPVVNHGEAAVLFCFAFLYLAISGAGSWSMDVFFRRVHSDDGRQRPGVPTGAGPMLRPQ
jgi:putative oxidoreductase